MKKLLLCICAIACAISLKAQSDTVRVYSPVQFESEVLTSKTGKQTTKYYAIVRGIYYETNKTSCDRYYMILRFKGEPCVVLITTGKTKKQKIIVL